MGIRWAVHRAVGRPWGYRDLAGDGDINSKKPHTRCWWGQRCQCLCCLHTPGRKKTQEQYNARPDSLVWFNYFILYFILVIYTSVPLVP